MFKKILIIIGILIIIAVIVLGFFFRVSTNEQGNTTVNQIREFKPFDRKPSGQQGGTDTTPIPGQDTPPTERTNRYRTYHKNTSEAPQALYNTSYRIHDIYSRQREDHSTRVHQQSLSQRHLKKQRVKQQKERVLLEKKMCPLPKHQNQKPL
jgi:hypothetical protein